MIKLKRAYEPAGGDDGARFLVERLWPRGVRKTRLKLDGWFKDAAPHCGPARAGHLRLRRARRSAQRRRRTEGVPRSAAMRLWRDACSSKES